MRAIFLLLCLLTALPVRGVTPELGKERLRKLARLPGISFPSEWNFDPERGFIVGSGEQETRAKINEVRGQMKGDISDAERYVALAQLYTSINEGKSAYSAWHEAAAMFRKRLELQPENGALQAGLGRALDEIGKDSEAESLLRQAVQVAPNDWKCRMALGRFLDSAARSSLYDGPNSAASGRLAPGVVALAQKQLDEAGICYDRAAGLAPEEAEVYFRRGMHRCLKTFLLNQVRLVSDTQDDLNSFSDYFSQESLADLQRASRLSRDDYRRIGSTVLFEIYATCSQKGHINWAEFSWNTLPDKAQQSVRDAIARLEGLAEKPEPRMAAGALEVLGILQGPILHQRRNCALNLRRALALDPSRDQAWDMLAGTLSQAGDYDGLLAVCEDEVKVHDSSRSRLLLAKAFEKLKQWESCEENLRVAVQQDETNFTAALALGSLLLKRSHDDATVLADAGNWLARSELLISKMPKEQRTQEEIIDLTLSRSIFFGLSDDVETARAWAKAVIQVDKENKLAQEILAAMDY